MSGADMVRGVGCRVASTSVVSGSALGSSGAALGSVDLTFPTVDVVATDDLGAVFQATGGHTAYGQAFPFDADRYFWISVNGIGADPALAGMTGTEIVLTGAGPWTPTEIAIFAVTLASGLGYSVSRSVGTVSVDGVDVAGTLAARDALVDFDSRGGAHTLGAIQLDTGSNASGGATGWVQVHPDNVPSGPFRVIGFAVRRGNNVTNGIRMAVASGPNLGNPEGAIVGHQRTMENSGANTWHVEWLSHDEVVEYTGGEHLFIGYQGNGATSSIYGSSSVDTGLYADGTTTLWNTDGTIGAYTPIVSPAGAVTTSYNYGIPGYLIIQEAPYQNDGVAGSANDAGYRVLAGAVPGVHDTGLAAPSPTDVNNIFVGWGFVWPDISGLTAFDVGLNLETHASGDSNQLRVELWDTTGGVASMSGDLIDTDYGQTTGVATGWQRMGITPHSLTPGGSNRLTFKGSPSVGEEADTSWRFESGGFGVAVAGHPSYSLQGGALENEELEFSAINGETSIDFRSQNATASPVTPDSSVLAPGNVAMFYLMIGVPGGTLVETP